MRTSSSIQPSRPRWLAASVLGVVLATSLAVAPAAEAQSPSDAVSGVVVRTDGGPAAQAISVNGLYPGAQHEAAFFFDGDLSALVDTVAFDVVNVRDLENGCNRPEQHVPDPSCGSGDDQGELSEFLEIQVFSGVEQTTSGSPRSCVVEDVPVGSHLLGEAARVVVDRSSAVGPGRMCLTATLRHLVKGSIDNLTQTDRVLFDLELRFEGEVAVSGVRDETDVLGVTASAPRTVVPAAVIPAGKTLNVGLAATGFPVVVWVGVALLLVTGGALALRVRPRREPT